MTHAHHHDGFWRFVCESLPPAPALVLDVGCGTGATTRRLRALGYAAVGVDPDAPDDDGFERTAVESFRSPQEFDAALAVRSIHHVERLDAAVDAIADALAPGARLVMFEFAVEAIDERGQRWSVEHALRRMPTAESDHDLVPLARIRAELERRFEPVFEQPTPYLAREAGRAELEPAERGAIEAGELSPAGARLVYARRSGGCGA